VKMAVRQSIVALTLLVVATGLPAAPPPTERLTVSLRPEAVTLEADEASRGGVRFNATITNTGTAAITVAHPSICFPADYEQGSTKTREDAHGRSEIILTIIRPDGERVILRDGWMGFFDPGNLDHFVIPPGEEETFHLGWFFPNARGRWENDTAAWTVFDEPGTYRVRLLFRNLFPKAIIRDHTTGKPRWIEAWTGELESNEATLEIKRRAD